MAKKISKLSLCLYPCLILMRAILVTESNPYIFLNRVSIIVGVVWAINLARICVEKGFSIPTFFTSATFFIFAFHSPYIGQASKVVNLLLPADISVTLATVASCVLYFLIPIVFILLLSLCYHALKRAFPTFTSILVGNR